MIGDLQINQSFFLQGKQRINIYNLNYKPKTFKCTIEHAVWPIIFIGQLLGLCSINITKKDGKLSFESSTGKLFYTLALATSFIIISILSFIDQDEYCDSVTTGTNVSIFKELVGKYLPFALVLTILTSSQFQKQHLTRFLQILYTVDEELKHSGVQMDYNNTRKRFLIETSIVSIFSIFAAICCFYFYNLTSSLKDTMSLAFIVVTFSQFTGCLKIMRRRFVIINKQMNLWKARGNITFVQSTDRALLLPMNKLKVLSASHDGLCEAADHLNSVFTMQMLLYTALVFLGALFTIFSDFRVMFSFEACSEKEVGKEIVRNSVMSVFTFGFMVKILYECSATSEEVSTSFLSTCAKYLIELRFFIRYMK